ISITDGQIYLEGELFNSGIRPAINVGLSVSRVGGSAQVKAMRKVSGQIRLDLAHYREMVLFSRFGSDIDASTKAVIAKGERLTEAVKQPQYAPLSMPDMVITLCVMTRDKLKNVEVKKVNSFLSGFIDFFHVKYADTVKRIEETGDLSDMDVNDILTAVDEYTQRS
ncbi:MAG: F0F1 ATP synthase subunit alpha, partial [Clostridia bacterium]|nr:F0F1 ATP synthase subunit alpha [Clostridia bacterium]